MKLNILLSFICIFILISCSSSGDRLEGLKAKQGQKTYTVDDYQEMALNFAKAYENSFFSSNDDLKKALIYFNKVLEIKKQDVNTLYNIARLYVYSGNYKDGRNLLKKCLLSNRSMLPAYSLLTRSYIMEGKMEQARTIAEQSSSLLPSSLVLKNDYATVLVKIGDYEEAKKLAIEMIKINAKYTPAYITLGNVYYLEDKKELARLIYLKALDAGDKTGELYANLGIITVEDNKNEGVNMLKDAVLKSNLSETAHLNLGKLLIDTGDYEGALLEFKHALKINPEFMEALLNIGIVYTRMKVFDKAEASYKKVIKIEPASPEVYFNYGILLSDYLDNKSKALEMYDKFISLSPKKLSPNHPVYKYIDEITKKQKRNKKLKGQEPAKTENMTTEPPQTTATEPTTESPEADLIEEELAK